MKLIFAFDLGTKTGWAMAGIRPGLPVQVQSGVESFKPGRFDGGGMRILRFRRWLEELGTGFETVLVCYEEVRRHVGTDAAHVYGGLQGQLTAWCEERGIPYQAVPVLTIKKHVTGKAKASKEDVMAWAARHFKTTVIDDNHADALAILQWMLDDETTRTALQRPAPDCKPEGRVPVGPVPMVGQDGHRARAQNADDSRRSDRRKRLSPSVADQSPGGRRRRAVLAGR